LRSLAARSGRIPFYTPANFFEMPPLFFLPPRAEIEKNPLIASQKLRFRTRNGSNAPRRTYACSGGLPCCLGCPLAVLYCEACGSAVVGACVSGGGLGVWWSAALACSLVGVLLPMVCLMGLVYVIR